MRSSSRERALARRRPAMRAERAAGTMNARSRSFGKPAGREEALGGASRYRNGRRLAVSVTRARGRAAMDDITPALARFGKLTIRAVLHLLLQLARAPGATAAANHEIREKNRKRQHDRGDHPAGPAVSTSVPRRLEHQVAPVVREARSASRRRFSVRCADRRSRPTTRPATPSHTSPFDGASLRCAVRQLQPTGGPPPR